LNKGKRAKCLKFTDEFTQSLARLSWKLDSIEYYATAAKSTNQLDLFHLHLLNFLSAFTFFEKKIIFTLKIKILKKLTKY